MDKSEPHPRMPLAEMLQALDEAIAKEWAASKWAQDRVGERPQFGTWGLYCVRRELETRLAEERARQRKAFEEARKQMRNKAV